MPTLKHTLIAVMQFIPTQIESQIGKIKTNQQAPVLPEHGIDQGIESAPGKQENQDMNEIDIQQFVKLTEEFISTHKHSLEKRDLEKVTELYDDLSMELSRQQLFDDLYH